MIAFYLPGGMPVYVFPLFLGLGASAGLAWISWQTPAKKANHYLDAGLFVLLGCLLGGRAVFVLLNWPYFQVHPQAILQVPLGGLAWPGALFAGILALLAWGVVLRQPIAPLADALMPLAAVLVVTAWLGCWVDGCAYGQAADAWWAMPGYNEWGLLARRVPVQFLGALLTAGLFWFADRYRPRNWPDGLPALLALLLLSTELFWLSTLRADPAPAWRGLRLDTWAALGYTLLAAISIAITFRKTRKTP